MKSLCQVVEKKVIDWNTIIANKLAGKPIKYSQEELEEFSNDWVTCACGNQCSVIPRNDMNEPYDYKLRMLGLEFNDFVISEKWNKAKQTLKSIEKRSGFLIREHNKQIKEDIKLLNKEKAQIDKEIAQKQKEIV